MTTRPLLDDVVELCPSCGEFKSLVVDTGWCLPCTREHHPDLSVCEHCNQLFTPRDSYKITCSRCDEAYWYERNADRLEQYMRIGLPVEVCIERVRYENRPRCLCCGRKMKHARKGVHFFCRDTALCKTTARRYKWLRERYNLSKEEAIAQALAHNAQEQAA